MTNYLFNDTDRFKLINHLDGDHWEGALPYTMLVEPGGKVVYRIEGSFDTGLLKKKSLSMLVEHILIKNQQQINEQRFPKSMLYIQTRHKLFWEKVRWPLEEKSAHNEREARPRGL